MAENMSLDREIELSDQPRKYETRRKKAAVFEMSIGHY
jgi:hypothetical protein